MQIKGWQFSPGLWPGVITVILLPLLVSLGFWQLDRAEQKREIYEQFKNRQSAAIIDLNLDSPKRHSKQDILWHQIKLKGVFDPGINILLDNQVVNSAPGYFVFNAFMLDDEWLLVNRGWLPTGADRSIAPAIYTPKEEVELIAVATDVPTTGILLGNNNIERISEEIFRMQKIDIEEVSKITGLKLLPFIARLEPESDHGFVREWVMPGSGEEKHLGYAFQWFALALTLLIIFLVVNIKRSKHIHE